jgi:hypothetical protein
MILDFAAAAYNDCGPNRAVVLAGDQLAVPAQDRVGRDKARKLAKPATTDDPALADRGRPAAVADAAGW